MEYFGFGRKFVCYIRTLTKDFEAVVQHAGNLTRKFPLKRGVKQGDPLSSLLFIMCVEILAIRLKEDNLLRHYNMDGVLVKQVLYADDCNIFLAYHSDSLRRLIMILEDFKRLSGLKIALNKTQVVYLGGTYTQNLRLCPDIDLA